MSRLNYLEMTPKEFKWHVRREHLLCYYCAPHKGENARREYRYPVKKAYQLDPKRRHKLL